MKTAIVLVAIIAAVASPIFAEEALEAKKQDKRGVLGLGYGGYYNGLGYSGHGYSGLGYGGYGGYGYLGAPLYNSAHGSVLPAGAYAHGPVVGNGYHGSIYNSPYRVGYNGLGLGHGLGLGVGHGLNYW
ncbi:glycine-rich protein-like [Copidosoma floridanum]|uniref:glycine-rich protein-like n=1 Tax=Copidosoma floridanum TaxID=29053 RepID=UPI0006C99D0D|nr:glycine-rich protein-like [Copidosoma floridanum]